ncbi:MAG: hypothetical protein AAFZ38_00710 [Myxococcota bacterium]
MTRTAQQARGATQQIVNRFTGISRSDQVALSQFVRPEFGGTKLPARTILEPMIAVGAVMALAASLGVGLISFVGMLIAGWIIYTILTQVFGLELDVVFPRA